ncbi:cytochrome [Candidatus Gracilibacteria bacterium]|nr:cytochrome [Candidatus Gracilibacteria bacterium]
MKKIIGIMGPGDGATEQDKKNAFEIGKYAAEHGYVVLTGGRNIGVMEAGLQGAKSANGTTVGILPNDDRSTFSEYVDIPIITNMRSGRNYMNVLSSDLVFACGMGAGTSSEVSLALQAGKNIILVGTSPEANAFFKQLNSEKILIAKDYTEALLFF